MYKDKKILALITARGGSKGIPQKNIKPLAGLPLIAWTIKTALKSSYIDSLILSTDNMEIAKIAEDYGCKVPFMRPAQYAQDESCSMSVILHALAEYDDHFDYLLLLQPTSPFRTTTHIDDIIQYAIDNVEAQVVSVNRVKKSPEYLFHIDKNNALHSCLPSSKQVRRQDMLATYEHNGALYISDINYLKANQSYLTKDTKAFVTEGIINLDLDTQADLDLAEYYIEKRKIKTP